MPDEVFSELRRVSLPAYRMAKARVFSCSPEEDVISFMEGWLRERDIDPARCRKFGFDVMVPEKDRVEGVRGYEYWAAVPQGLQGDELVAVEQFTGGEYLVLRIAEPFSDPFDRIPRGWQKLVKHIRESGIKADWCSPGGCLEEVLQTDEGACMDIFIRLL